MGIYNFQKRFVPMIKSGRKTHTIRATRVHVDKPGNTLHLYTGLRTKKAKLLMRVTCAAVQEIAIFEQSHPDFKEPYRRQHFVSSIIEIDGAPLSPSEIEALAWRDGFKDFAEMIRFWDGRLPFRGHIIHWRR